MKKILLSLILMAFAATATVNAQSIVKQEVKKECCKDHKDGQKCDKPADQQCPDCKAKAAEAKQHECKKAQGQKCEKAEGMKCEGKKLECKEGMKDCKKAEGMKCDKANAEKKDCCKDKKMEGKKCDKPADQKDCCKDKAKKN